MRRECGLGYAARTRAGQRSKNSSWGPISALIFLPMPAQQIGIAERVSPANFLRHCHHLALKIGKCRRSRAPDTVSDHRHSLPPPQPVLARDIAWGCCPSGPGTISATTAMMLQNRSGRSSLRSTCGTPRGFTLETPGFVSTPGEHFEGFGSSKRKVARMTENIADLPSIILTAFCSTSEGFFQAPERHIYTTRAASHISAELGGQRGRTWIAHTNTQSGMNVGQGPVAK